MRTWIEKVTLERRKKLFFRKAKPDRGRNRGLERELEHHFPNDFL